MKTATSTEFGALLRSWRERRQLTQACLSERAGVSTRHLSFLETGRSRPSRDMVLRLAEYLDVPLRETNHLLTSAGFAAAWAQRDLDAPEMAPIRDVLDVVLRGHEPCPAIAVDRAWDVVALNRPAQLLAGLVADHLREPTPNVYRMALHPDGLAPYIVNFAEFAHHVVAQLRRDASATGAPVLADLLSEVLDLPDVRRAVAAPPPVADRVVVPLRLRHPAGELSLFTMVSTFGTPADITVDELTLETFFPADDHTAAVLRELAP